MPSTATISKQNTSQPHRPHCHRHAAPAASPQPPYGTHSGSTWYGAERVLEQELRAASSALALGEGDMASCAAYVGWDASRYFRVNLDFCRYTRVLPGVGLMSSKFMAPDHTAS